MFNKIIITSNHQDNKWHGYLYKPHNILTTICNIHQALLESGIQQELFTTNERLIDNILNIFPKMLSTIQPESNHRIVANRATANMFKWLAFMPMDKSPVKALPYSQQILQTHQATNQQPPTTSTPQPQLLKRKLDNDENISSVQTKRSKKQRENRKRGGKKPKKIQSTQEPKLLEPTLCNANESTKSLTISLDNSKSSAMLAEMSNDPDLSNWIIVQAEQFLKDKQELENFAASPSDPVFVLEDSNN